MPQAPNTIQLDRRTPDTYAVRYVHTGDTQAGPSAYTHKKHPAPEWKAGWTACCENSPTAYCERRDVPTYSIAASRRPCTNCQQQHLQQGNGPFLRRCLESAATHLLTTIEQTRNAQVTTTSKIAAAASQPASAHCCSCKKRTADAAGETLT
jgi:hypothetical protein